jgi:hypothetical protein
VKLIDVSQIISLAHMVRNRKAYFGFDLNRGFLSLKLFLYDFIEEQ